MAIPRRTNVALGAAFLTLALAAAAQAQSTAPPNTPPATTPQAQPPSAPGQTAPAPPKPAPGAELPPVEIIQKQVQTTPVTPKKKTVAAKTPPAAAPPPPASPPTAPAPPDLPQIEGTGGIDDGSVLMSPLAGSAIPIWKYPGAVGRASASDIDRAGTTYVPSILQQTVPGAILEDAQGNGFQQNLQYRGFDSSPVNGVPQGLAVYQNGVRINESFGDIVNWDFLPDSAIEGITIVGANPVFGLNALGGAVTILMRDGFSFQGTEIDVRAGSYGRIQGELATGQRSGNWAGFLSLEGIRDDGWRQFSPADIRRTYFDVGAKDSTAEAHFNFTGADNFVGVTAAAPVQLLDLNWANSFTSPQTTDNRLSMLSLNGLVKATPTLTFSGLAYYRWFQQKHLDGNISEADDCDNPFDPLAPEVVCFEGDDPANPLPAIDANGRVQDFADGTAYGTLDRTSQNANSFGFSGQGVEKTRIMGLHNQFLLGASYDRGNVGYGSSSELGTFGPDFVVSPLSPPFLIVSPLDFAPRNIRTTNDYVGVYFSDTLDLTPQLSLTVGGRYNFARLALLDETGNFAEITGAHTYQRFNPMAGLAYQITPELTAYGGYAEANRAPTPAELSCADPDNPCLIESFLTADPELQQVVSRTFELGLRGKSMWWGDRKIEWSAGLFRAMNYNDILPLAAPQTGRGYFQNVGDTLRQGVELGLRYTDKRTMIYANYAFVNATIETDVQLPSPDNPTAIPCDGAPDAQCANASAGDRLPGVPQHRFKAGFDYWFTSTIKAGADLLVASNQYFYGDWSNANAPLAGYAAVDLHGSWDVTDHVQIYGLINNLFDSRYGLFGTYFNLEGANGAAAAAGLGDGFFTDPRTITPVQPFAAYGGVKVKF